MLSTAVIVFRETLEIALMLGVVLAATRGVKGRGPWIAAGFGAGAAGAGLVAAFTEVISGFFGGAGQEIFNAAVLFIAAAFVGCTAVWMRGHGREVTAQLKKTGADVAAGALPLSALVVIIGLSMLREGSEIALFLYGQALSGQGALTIAAGTAAGVLAGVAAGVALYYGLIRTSVGHMFQLTGWLLVFLVAGLAAQGAGFLTSAGYFSGLSGALWNSSWLVSDEGIAGKLLHGLIGYSARPSEIQGIFYLLTLGGLMFAMKKTGSHGGKPARAAAAIVMVLALCASGKAWALDDVKSPNVEAGEFEMEYKGTRSFDSDRAKDNAQAHEVSIGYGFGRWKPELAVIFEKEPGEGTDLKEVEFENTIQFFESGQYWVDSGLLLAYGHALRDRDRPDAFEAKLLLEKQTGPYLHRANIGFEHDAGHGSTGGQELAFLWSSRYRLIPEFEPGIELQSNFGKTSTMHGGFDEQEHYLGPAAYGHFGHLKYEIAWLPGISDAAAASAARLKLEYEVHF
jgi:high-affinity iron transporter